MTKNRRMNEFKEGLLIALPIILGYFPISMAFGLLSKNTGVPFGATNLFSILVYAGASQFMALDLIQSQVSIMGIILATFLLNLRNMMMSASLAIDLKEIDRKYLPILAFGITDGTFSLVSFNKEKISTIFVGTVFLLSYGSWCLGTMAGYLVGEILPASLQSSLGIGLHAMFIALLIPEIKKSLNTLLISLISAFIYIIICNLKIFTSGWDIILGIIISSALGVLIFKDKEEGLN